MSTYKERMENKQNFVLINGGQVLGTFGNLKKVCDFLEGRNFYSYHTLSRKTFPVSYNGFTLFKVKHY